MSDDPVKKIRDEGRYQHGMAREDSTDRQRDLISIQLLNLADAQQRSELEAVKFRSESKEAMSELRIAVMGKPEIGLPGLTRGYQDNHDRIKELESMAIDHEKQAELRGRVQKHDELIAQGRAIFWLVNILWATAIGALGTFAMIHHGG